ncbi:MAG: PEP-CTERM sorting domain-containing protein [Sedimentisphaerales bacterium]
MSGSTFGCAKSVLVFVVILFTLVAVQPAGAVAFPWDNPNGGNSDFSWANGGSEYGRFGSPHLDTGNTLIFSPISFEAVSLDGESVSVSDKLEFEASSGYGFQTILITESGDYEIEEAGTVSASGTLWVENLDTSVILSEPLSFTLLLTESTWQGSAQVSIAPTDWTYIKVTFENELSATAADGSVASIENTASDIKIQVPEPATIGLLTLGSLVFIGKKK